MVRQAPECIEHREARGDEARKQVTEQGQRQSAWSHREGSPPSWISSTDRPSSRPRGSLHDSFSWGLTLSWIVSLHSSAPIKTTACTETQNIPGVQPVV